MLKTRYEEFDRLQEQKLLKELLGVESEEEVQALIMSDMLDFTQYMDEHTDDFFHNQIEAFSNFNTLFADFLEEYKENLEILYDLNTQEVPVISADDWLPLNDQFLDTTTPEYTGPDLFGKQKVKVDYIPQTLYEIAERDKELIGKTISEDLKDHVEGFVDYSLAAGQNLNAGDVYQAAYDFAIRNAKMEHNDTYNVDRMGTDLEALNRMYARGQITKSAYDSGIELLQSDIYKNALGVEDAINEINKERAKEAEEAGELSYKHYEIESTSAQVVAALMSNTPKNIKESTEEQARSLLLATEGMGEKLDSLGLTTSVDLQNVTEDMADKLTKALNDGKEALVKALTDGFGSQLTKEEINEWAEKAITEIGESKKQIETQEYNFNVRSFGVYDDKYKGTSNEGFGNEKLSKDTQTNLNENYTALAKIAWENGNNAAAEEYIKLANIKARSEDYSGTIKSVSLDLNTGLITKTKKDGTTSTTQADKNARDKAIADGQVQKAITTTSKTTNTNLQQISQAVNNVNVLNVYNAATQNKTAQEQLLVGNTIVALTEALGTNIPETSNANTQRNIETIVSTTGDLQKTLEASGLSFEEALNSEDAKIRDEMTKGINTLAESLQSIDGMMKDDRAKEEAEKLLQQSMSGSSSGGRGSGSNYNISDIESRLSTSSTSGKSTTDKYGTSSATTKSGDTDYLQSAIDAAKRGDKEAANAYLDAREKKVAETGKGGNVSNEEARALINSYASGIENGPVTFTGTAMLHGSPSSPEYVLNTQQAGNVLKYIATNANALDTANAQLSSDASQTSEISTILQDMYDNGILTDDQLKNLKEVAKNTKNMQTLLYAVAQYNNRLVDKKDVGEVIDIASLMSQYITKLYMDINGGRGVSDIGSNTPSTPATPSNPSNPNTSETSTTPEEIKSAEDEIIDSWTEEYKKLIINAAKEMGLDANDKKQLVNFEDKYRRGLDNNYRAITSIDYDALISLLKSEEQKKEFQNKRILELVELFGLDNTNKDIVADFVNKYYDKATGAWSFAKASYGNSEPSTPTTPTTQSTPVVDTPNDTNSSGGTNITNEDGEGHHKNNHWDWHNWHKGNDEYKGLFSYGHSMFNPLSWGNWFGFLHDSDINNNLLSNFGTLKLPEYTSKTSNNDNSTQYVLHGDIILENCNDPAKFWEEVTKQMGNRWNVTKKR